MARPLKLGLDYFPLDVNFDDTVELIEAEHGLEGFAILIKIWQKIYSNGYYMEWNADTELLFSKKINTDRNKVSSVINSCLLRNIFNNSMYKQFGVLTSTGIQKRYLVACSSSKRKNIIFEEKYLLVEDTYKKLITELIKFTPEETPVNSGESTQRKGKERKGKESNIYTPEFELFYTEYPRPGEKDRTFSNWKKCIKENTIEEIMCAMKNYKGKVVKEKTENQFIKTSANFLGRDKYYKDYINFKEGASNDGNTRDSKPNKPEYDTSKIMYKPTGNFDPDKPLNF